MRNGAVEVWQARMENLQELLRLAGAFHSADALLEHAALSGQGSERHGDGDGQVRLMTLHEGKGQEFDHVFLPAWEAGLFPADYSDICEKRRLAYVALTRGRLWVTVSYCAVRRGFTKASCFIEDLPAGNVLHGWLHISHGGGASLGGVAIKHRQQPRQQAQALLVRAAADQAATWSSREFDMPGTRGVLIRIAFAIGLLLPVASYASTPPSQTSVDAGRSPSMARTAEPESVRSALSALVSACANWPQELPASPKADLAVLKGGTPIDAILCDAVVDSDGRRFPIMMVSLLITAAVLGTFAGAFMASAALLRWMCRSIRQAMFAARGMLSSLGDR